MNHVFLANSVTEKQDSAFEESVISYQPTWVRVCACVPCVFPLCPHQTITAFYVSDYMFPVGSISRLSRCLLAHLSRPQRSSLLNTPLPSCSDRKQKDAKVNMFSV